jgi:hypothetical protein
MLLRQDQAAVGLGIRLGCSIKGSGMLRFKRRLMQLVMAAALAATAGACSNDFNMSDLDPSRKFATLTRPNWLTFSGHQEELTLPNVAEADLIGREGQCASGVGTTASSFQQSGIALQMTECEVVTRAGAPDNIEFGVNERGERAVALTYLSGPRPGVYRFAGGRLTSIERGPEPPAAPAKPQRAPAKKSGRA